MTVETEQLPVTPVGGIIVVGVVFVMHGQLAQFFATKDLAKNNFPDC
jgi:hypothetical protein